MSDVSRKGIILAGGAGTRLYPLTKAVSKQLMPIYDKPMIYYPLTTLMSCGIKDILIICNPYHLNDFKDLLGNGKQWGIEIQYKSQPSPDGIAQAFLLGKDFLEDKNVALILGDNLFYGNNFEKNLKEANQEKNGATLFAYPVSDPSRYGIVNFNKDTNKVDTIIEKPSNPTSNFAVTGLYFYDNNVIDYAENLTPSARNELEITDINKRYLAENNLKVQILGSGMAWLDTGTFDSLQEAGTFIRTLEKRQGLKIGSPEETAWRNKLINDHELMVLASEISKSSYGSYLINLIKPKFLKRMN
tara:strand:- start:1834 stop:2739 length:906 start_codon:yes stop_codon:yes gene_type:complete